ncbi:MAG: TolC family protein, partial [Culturomica sp.]|nr:TolC family protein [Culturomica sp.]
ARAAKAKYEATGAAVEAAQEALLYAQERYDVGRLTAYELGEAQAKSVSAQSEQLQAKYEYLFRMKIIQFYKGETE